MMIVPILAGLTLVFLGASTLAAGRRPQRPAANWETNH